MSKRGIMSGAREVFKNPLTATPVWHVIDAKGHVVGRVANTVSKILLGKHKPVYDPAVDTGDYVVVVNARHAQFTGRRKDLKYYKWHTGFVGGLKKMAAKTMFERNPTKVLHHAIMGMIPKNRLKSMREKKLKLYADDQHPHVNQIAASSSSPIQRNIPVNARYQQHMKISEEEQLLVGGKEITLYKTKLGDLDTTRKKIPSLLQRAKLNRALTRLAQNGELKQFYKPPKEDPAAPLDAVEHTFEIGTEPARLPFANESRFKEEDTSSVLWDWPKQDEKFDDNPEQLGRIMTQKELDDVIAQEDFFVKEDKWRLVMRLARVQMERAKRLKMPVPERYLKACRTIPTQFIIDEKDADRRMREALGLLDSSTKNATNDEEFGDFSFGFTERTKEEMSKPATSFKNAAPAAAGKGPVGKGPVKK